MRYPKSVSGRKILDQNGDVFLLPTMSSWSMASNLSDAEITTALEGVAANHFKGVTVWMGGGYTLGGTWHQYTNDAGSNFWAGTPWASSLGAAWTSVDRVVSECLRLELVVCLSICGGNGLTGARPDWEAATNTNMYDAGVAIATRYSAYDHIVWHTMLDSSHIPSTTAGQRVEAFWDGVNDTEGASRRPVRWMEVDNGATTDDQGWMNTTQFACTINCIYDYTSDSVVNFEGGWAQTSAPTGDCEPRYVGNSISQQDLRERNYAVFLEGGSVMNFGHEDWWPFGATGLFTDGETWDTVQADDEVVQSKWCWDLIDTYCKSPAWEPTSSFVTTGAGATDTKAAIGASPGAALAYFPDSRTIVVDTTILFGTGNVKLRWYDPTLGTFSDIAASEAQNASRSVTYKSGTHTDGAADWVLVVELVDGLPAPTPIRFVR